MLGCHHRRQASIVYSKAGEQLDYKEAAAAPEVRVLLDRAYDCELCDQLVNTERDHYYSDHRDRIKKSTSFLLPLFFTLNDIVKEVEYDEDEPEYDFVDEHHPENDILAYT